jgi:hypothetical protein
VTGEPAHARLGPSNHRWPNCAGSVREEANYEDVSGAAAIDGTGSHLLLEMCLENNVRANTYDGQIIGVNHPDMLGGWLVGLERCARVQICLDYVESRVKELSKIYPNVSVEAEKKVDVGGMFGRTDWWGTCDITIKCRNSQAQVLFVEACDYKDGRGYVHHIDNGQLLDYCAGNLRPHIASGADLVRPFNPSRVPQVRMSIVQPKTRVPVRYQDATATYVMDKVIERSQAARNTDDPDAPLTPDKKGGKGYCQWCKHKPNCSAQSERSLGVFNNMENLQIGQASDLMEMAAKSGEAIAAMGSDELVVLADAKAGFDAMFAKVEAEIQARIDRGDVVNGFGMVNGNASKKWALSEEEMVKKLKARKLKQSDYYPQKLASPAQILALKSLTDKQKVAITKDLITEVAGKKKLSRVEYSKAEKDVNTMFCDVPVLNIEETVVQCATDVVDSVPEVSFF